MKLKNIRNEKLNQLAISYIDDMNFSLINNISTKNKNLLTEESDVMDYEEEINNYKIQIESLKELIYEKENEVLKIIEENQELKKELKSSREYSKNINDLGDNNINSTFSSRFSELKDENKLDIKEKYNKMKASYEQFKVDNNNLMEQMTIIKSELKNEREKYQSLFSLEGKIKDPHEFIELYNKLFEGYKPKNKSQEEAYKKFNIYINSLNNDDSSIVKDVDKSKSVDSDGKKNGFFGKFFKKGK